MISHDSHAGRRRSRSPLRPRSPRAQDLPDEADHDDRAVRGRRPDRHRGARSLAQSMTGTLKQPVIVENVRRRRRHDRADKVAKTPARRLHAAARPYRHVDRAGALPHAAVHAARGLRARSGQVVDVPMTFIAKKDSAAEGLQGARRLRQGEQGQGDARQRRPRRGVAPVRPAVHDRDPDRRSRRCRTRARRPAMNDLLGGQVDFMCDQTTNTTSSDQVRQDQGVRGDHAQARVVAEGRRRRCRSRAAGLRRRVWHGVYAPKGTPKPVIDKLDGRAAGRASPSRMSTSAWPTSARDAVRKDKATPEGAAQPPQGRDRQVDADHQEGGRLRGLKSSETRINAARFESRVIDRGRLGTARRRAARQASRTNASVVDASTARPERRYSGGSVVPLAAGCQSA